MIARHDRHVLRIAKRFQPQPGQFDLAVQGKVHQISGYRDVIGSPRLHVLDDRLPDASALKQMHAIVGRCPVIVVTAFGGPRVRAEAMARGAAVYLDKPFRVGDFLLAVRRALGWEPPRPEVSRGGQGA